MAAASFPMPLRLIGWSQRLRGEAIIVFLARLASVGFGLVFVFVTARHLGAGGRGEIVVAFTVAWATTHIADLGISTSGRISLLRPNGGVEPSDVVSLTVVLLPFQLVLSSVVVVVLLMTSLQLSHSLLVGTVVLSVAVMMFNSAKSLFYGLRRYRDVLVAEVCLAVFHLMALAVLLVSSRLTSTSAVAMMAVGYGVCSVWLVWDSGVAKHGLRSWRVTHWRQLVLDGLSPMAGGTAVFVALRVDRLLLPLFAGTHVLGIYSVALAIPEALRILPYSVGQVIADRGRSHIDTVAESRRHTRIFVVAHVLVLAIAALVGWVLLPVVFGTSFVESRDVLVIVVAAEAVLSIHLMHQALLVGFARPKGLGVPQVVGAVAVVALDLVMIPRWGIQGAAWAALTGYSIMALVSTVWTNHELRRMSA